ncbi:MAG: Carbohydrate binding domain, partial [Bacteroidetes bacterium HLUCCA01]
MKHLLPRLGALILLLGLMMPATVNAQETEPPTRPLLLDFTVDMNFTIDEGIFNPDTDQLFMTGDVANWASDPADLAPFELQQIPTIPGEFSFNFEIQIPDVTYDMGLEFKLLIVTGTGEKIWEGDPTRYYSVTPTTMVLGDTEILSFADPIPGYGEREVTFVVDMSVPLAEGVFQPEIGDFVSVPGEWNNWSTVDQLVPIDGMPGFYDGVINVRGVEGQTAEYKFLIVAADGRDLPSGGWELFTDPVTGMEDMFLNRSLTLGPNDEPMIIPHVPFSLATITEPPPEGFVPVSDARMLDDGTPVSVRGILTTPVISAPGMHVDFYIADETGGIRVYTPTEFVPNIPAPELLVPGMPVEVHGVRNNFNGDLQVVAESIVMSEYVPEFIPFGIIDNYADWSADSRFMGQPILIPEVSVLDPATWPVNNDGNAMNVTLVDAMGQQYVLRITPDNNELHGSPVPEGVFAISGVMGEFNEIPQIYSFFLDDIIYGDLQDDNLITNGDFETGDLQPWSVYVADFEGVNANVSILNGELVVDNITGAGAEGWHLQVNQILDQNQIDQLQVGKTYTIQFDARAAEEDRPLFVFFGEQEGGFAAQTLVQIPLSTTMETYLTTFTLTSKYPAMKLGFEGGTSNVDFVLDNVFMYMEDDPGFVSDLYLPVTFEDAEVDYGLTDFGGNLSEIVADPEDPANTVVRSVKTDTSELWAGTTVGGSAGFATPIPFEPGLTTMSIRVWSPLAGAPVRVKVENAQDPTISVETEAIASVGGEWQTLVFDFANEAMGTSPIDFSGVYNKLSIFYNFGTAGSQAGELTFYWDDIFFGGTGTDGLRDVTFNVNVEDINNRGIFNPDADAIFVRGSFNGWSAEMPMDRVGDFDFTQTWSVPGPEGGFIEYKYYIVAADQRELPNGGWELFIDPFTGEPDAFLNRYLDLGADEMAIETFDVFELVEVPTNFLPVTLQSSDNGIMAGDPLSIDVLVGSPEEIAENLYGVGMTLFYDTNAFVFESIERGEMLTGYEDVLLEFLDVTSSGVEIFFSFTLTDDQLTLPGFGQLATLNFTALPDAVSGTYSFSTSAEEAIDNVGGFLDVLGDFIFVDIIGQGMYPGDTNLDGIVDAFDVDPLSLWFLEMGPPRPMRSIQWALQEFYPWEMEAAAFADASGDGIVNQNDLLPIGLNFGKTTPDYMTPQKLAVASESPVAFTLPAMQPGDVVRFQVDLGTDNYPITEVRSLAMNLGFDAASLSLTSAEAGSWTADGQLLQLNRYDADRGLQSLSLARTDGAAMVEGSAVMLTFEAQDAIAE